MQRWLKQGWHNHLLEKRKPPQCKGWISHEPGNSDRQPPALGQNAFASFPCGAIHHVDLMEHYLFPFRLLSALDRPVVILRQEFPVPALSYRCPKVSAANLIESFAGPKHLFQFQAILGFQDWEPAPPLD